MAKHMPTGLKQTSSLVAIGARVVETGANTYTQQQIDLNLSPLDREVFVVLAVNLDPQAPENVAGTNTAVSASVTSTSQTSVQGLDNANCIANTRLDILQDAGSVTGVPFTRGAGESQASLLEYLGIIATNDFFIGIKGTGNTAAKFANAKVYGYRARASADIYAALVQSEVLSA